MNTNDKDEIKKEFHLERIVFFSDAIFSIIITIMILDVKLPALAENASEAESKQALFQLFQKVFAYGICFCLIASFWMRHMRIYGFVKDFDKQLLILNLFFLFGVSLFPFALSFWFSSSVIKQYSWGIYTFLGLGYFTLFAQDLLIRYLVKNKEELCIRKNEIENALRWKIRRLNFFTIPCIIALMICASYFNLKAYIVYGTLCLNGLAIRILNKRYYPNHKNERVSILSLLAFKKNSYNRVGRKLSGPAEI